MSHDRDRILEQALKHELRATPPPTGEPALRSFSEGGCLDAETLAAWEDGGLGAAAMEAAELHVSTCARCQALAGTMAKAIPVMVPVKSDEPFRLWKWWLAPIAAATAAVTIWMVVPAEREAAVGPPPAPVRDSAIAREPAITGDAAIARDAALAREAAIAQVERKATSIPEPFAPAPAQAPAAPQKLEVQLADRLQQRADAPAGLEDVRKRQENNEQNAAGKKEDADASRLMRENAVAVAETAAAAAGSRGAAPAPAAPAAEAAPAPPSIAALQKSARFASAPVEIASPDPMSRWRAVVTGVERSEDGGRTWIPVRAPGGEVITAGASPSRNVVWLVGRSGLVLVTVDGFTFARVDLSERADVAAISATDGRSATLTTTDGRTFRTDDSGRSWRRN